MTAFASWLEGELDRAWAAAPNPGRTEPFHRLNRVEYRNAVRDLLGLDLDVSSLLPGDDVSFGFDNIAGVLTLSPTLMERYLSAAQKVSRLAVGTPARTPSIDYYRVADDLSQDVHLPGLPLGTRGGTRSAIRSRWTAIYEIRPRLTRDLNESMPLYTEAQVLEISIDGQRVGHVHVASDWCPRRPRRSAAGPPAIPSGRRARRRQRRLRRPRHRRRARCSGGAAHRRPPPRTTSSRSSRASRDLADSRRRSARRRASVSHATAPTSRGTCACRSRPGSATS